MKRLITLSICGLLLACNTTTKQEDVQEQTKATLNVQAELAKIEQLRAAFQLAIKEKRYQDLGPMAAKDFKNIGAASEAWKEYRRQREEPMGMFS